MSILSSRATTVKDTPVNGIFVIYGSPGTGKTVLASSFPKTKDAPMLFLDVLEGGTSSIPAMYADNIQVIDIQSYADVQEIFDDIDRGFTLDDKGVQVPVKYSTIVIDTVTKLEYLMKKHLMVASSKDKMDLNLWGQTKEAHDVLWNLAKQLHKKTGAYIVMVCHQKELQDENNPSFNKIVPAVIPSAGSSICGDASFVWYTKVENEQVIDPKTNEVSEAVRFYTYIDTHPYLLSKCRKPMGLKVPVKVKDLCFDNFEKNVIKKIKL